MYSQTTALQDYVQACRKYTKAWWRRPAADITGADLKRLFFEVAHEHGRSIAVQQKLKAAINTIFEWGIESGRIRGVNFSPASNIKLVGRKMEKQTEILTQKQISQLLRLAKELNHPWYPIWFAAVHTGARSGELYALLWSDIDFEGSRLYINKSYSKRSNSIGPTKAGYWRDVPINSELMKFLKELRLQSSGRENVLPHPTDWTRGEQAKVLKTFLAQVGLPQVKFHTLRACFATHLLRHKVAPAIVMKICGWKDLETMQRYVRLAGIEVEGATDSLKFLSEKKVLATVVEIFGTQD
ncbi:MAG: site-specific integrase [Bdellovibrionaceae bacterium]|nr:site-specific integrase [Pseudobdellovibrionaceae bacterium]